MGGAGAATMRGAGAATEFVGGNMAVEGVETMADVRGARRFFVLVAGAEEDWRLDLDRLVREGERTGDVGNATATR